MLSVVVLLAGCAWLLSNTGPVAIHVESDFLVLSWDSPAGQIDDQPSSVDHFDVYYRPFGTTAWSFLHSTPDEKPTTTVASWDLHFGSYEFAVEEVYRDGSVSNMHTSSDYTSWPPGGWYVVWTAQ